MRLDSARNLKADATSLLRGALAAGGHEGFYEVRPGAVVAFDVRAQGRSGLERNQPLVALGITPHEGKRNQFKLAVRIQRRGLEDSPAVDAVAKQAKGEVDVRYIGSVVKRLPPPQPVPRPWYRTRVRPLQIGTSVGHVDVTAGTIGCFVRRRGGRGGIEVLSNNHVLADENEAEVGDAVVQPGVYDGGSARRHRVGKVRRMVTLKRGTNLVDCATCLVDEGVAVDPTTLRGVGTLCGLGAAEDMIDAPVGKIGRTTGVTQGMVTAFELDGVTVRFELGLLRFDDQYEIESTTLRQFSDGGDSGSLIYTDADKRAGALLFAGSDHGGSNGKGLTYANPLGTVLQKLNVELYTG